MTLLAIDTATRAMGLALYNGHQVLYEGLWQTKDFHTVELAPAIQKALRRSATPLKKVQAIALSIGPGSYTGLRIGLAMAKGMAFPRNLPLISIPTLDVLAACQPPQDLPMLAVIRAGRGRLAVAAYELSEGQWQQVREPQLLTAEEISAALKKPTLICGELSKAERRLLGRKRRMAVLASPAWSARRPSVLAELAWARFQAGDTDAALGLAPDYLQTNQAIPA